MVEIDMKFPINLTGFTVRTEFNGKQLWSLLT